MACYYRERSARCMNSQPFVVPIADTVSAIPFQLVIVEESVAESPNGDSRSHQSYHDPKNHVFHVELARKFI